MLTHLAGHEKKVISGIALPMGSYKLYSGSKDGTVRVWNCQTGQCSAVINLGSEVGCVISEDYTSVVMSVLCWDQFLLSCSLDQTIKVWAVTESGKLEVTYTHKEEHGLLALCGMPDAQGKPVLLCSCNDNTVRLYDLPSLHERGKIYAKEETRAIHTAPGGLFFTGDGNGDLKVWKWSEHSSPAAATIQQ
ncbi:hypothetical protein MKX01_003308 [Papaver californicum]|nr:hypothetical protein MKX01_003308 [Papaver californicum]